jgi:hypothetical protein
MNMNVVSLVLDALFVHFEFSNAGTSDDDPFRIAVLQRLIASNFVYM